VSDLLVLIPMALRAALELVAAARKSDVPNWNGLAYPKALRQLARAVSVVTSNATLIGSA
jgi:hypothetical protein